jgi:hypothetical protein
MAGYGTETGFEAWLEANGYSLPSGAPDAVVLLERGSAYVDGVYGGRFSGQPEGGYDQERQWPRAGAYAYGAAIPDDVVPDAVIKAAYAAAWQEATAPGSLSVSGSASSAVKREKVEGAVEVEYQTNSGAWTVESMLPVLSSIEGLLRPFLRSAEPGIGIWVI